AVLQAIHLLLAFELFVVVVGVDVQWIEGAVEKHFEGNTTTERLIAADTVNGKALTSDAVKAEIAEALKSLQQLRRKRAADYLEKIFQIPFWLDRLRTQAVHGGTPGGTYGAYVRDLLKKNETAESDKSIFKSALRRPKESATGAAS